MSRLNETYEALEAATPRIYVESLADFNAGRSLGTWIPASQSAEEIRKEISLLLKLSGEVDAKEWAIHDWEGFGSLKLGESEDITNVAKLASLVEEYGLIFAELLAHFGGLQALTKAQLFMEKGYCGEYGSLLEFVELFYIADKHDFELIIRNGIKHKHFWFWLDGQVHVFWSSFTPASSSPTEEQEDGL